MDNYYTDIDQAADELFAAGKREELIALLEGARDTYPGHLYDILSYLSIARLAAGDRTGGLDTLEEMADLGFFCDLSWPFFDPAREDPRFPVLLEKNDRLKDEARKDARMEYDVILPPGARPDTPCPFFFALHGNGESLDYFKHLWPVDPLTGRGYAVVFVKSSQVLCANASGWTDDYGITRGDLLSCYREIGTQYSIDTEKTLIGGFSGGAIASIEAVMADLFPLKGFIALCPSLVPDSFSPENAGSAAARGVRGVILKGELEGEMPSEKQIIEILSDAGVPFRFIVNPGTGHAFPRDFPKRLMQAVDYIMENPHSS